MVGATKTKKIGCITQKMRNINHLKLIYDGGIPHPFPTFADVFKRTLSSKPFLN